MKKNKKKKKKKEEEEEEEKSGYAASGWFSTGFPPIELFRFSASLGRVAGR